MNEQSGNLKKEVKMLKWLWALIASETATNFRYTSEVWAVGLTGLDMKIHIFDRNESH